MKSGEKSKTQLEIEHEASINGLMLLNSMGKEVALKMLRTDAARLIEGGYSHMLSDAQAHKQAKLVQATIEYIERAK